MKKKTTILLISNFVLAWLFLIAVSKPAEVKYVVQPQSYESDLDYSEDPEVFDYEDVEEDTEDLDEDEVDFIEEEFPESKNEEIFYDENPNVNIEAYWAEDFLKDCVAEGSYDVSYHPCGLYAQSMIVKDKGSDYIVFENSNGFKYMVENEPEDVGIGEIYCCIMYDNRTFDTVKDDIVVIYNYDRPDVWFE